MKKILVLVMVLVATSATTFAINPSDYDVFYKMNSTTTFNGLVRYLNADSEQAEDLKTVFSMTEIKMKSALKADNDNAAEKAMFFNLGNTRSILSKEQYRKYLTIVNLTINNKYDEVLLSIK